jgi:putative phosphoesterase
MANRKPVPFGLCAFGAMAIDGYLSALHDQLQGARDAEVIEFVHQSRVYSRRLRAALTIFADCFEPDDIKCWNKRVRAVTRSLGAARDLDVQILFLNDYLKERDEATRTQFDALVQELVGQRAALQSQVEDALALFESEGLVPRWHATLLPRAVPMDDPMWREVRTAALANVMVLTKELLDLAGCVADERAVEQHHQMRIAAKRLRYTLETFSVAYDDGLAAQIARLKKLQDILGEMHDCDVWIMTLVERLRWRCEPAMAALLLERQERRSALYHNLVAIWKRWVDQMVLSRLERKLFSGLRPNVREVALPELDPPTKIALISDVHGNLPALEAVMEDATGRGAVTFINAGDSIGWGPFDNEVAHLLQDGRFQNVLGNYDQNILRVRLGGTPMKNDGASLKHKVAEHAALNLSDASMSFLLGLPEDIRFEVAGKRVLVTHASPESIEEPIDETVPETRMSELAIAAKADLVVIGHTHHGLDRTVAGVRFINPGSIGRPVGGDPRASYALLDPVDLGVEFVRVRYDLDEVADRVMAVGLPKELALMFLSGRSPDEPEERVHPMSHLDRTSKTGMVEEVVRSFGHLDDHTQFVRSTAVQLFDLLQGEHGLGSGERYWLECGALLHDIGWSVGGEEHNLSSFNLILVDDRLPFDERERLIVASLARYHRKGLPKKGHANYGSLKGKERRTVDILGGILRVADGLDVRHNHDVRLIGCWTDPHLIIIEVADPQEHRYEIEAGSRKGKLFEKAFDRKLMIQ